MTNLLIIHLIFSPGPHYIIQKYFSIESDQLFVACSAVLLQIFLSLFHKIVHDITIEGACSFVQFWESVSRRFKRISGISLALPWLWLTVAKDLSFASCNFNAVALTHKAPHPHYHLFTHDDINGMLLHGALIRAEHQTRSEPDQDDRTTDPTTIVGNIKIHTGKKKLRTTTKHSQRGRTN